MAMNDGESGAVENRKDEHYVAMPGSWQARNNMDMNKAMGYNNMSDLSNVAHPPISMESAKKNSQLSPDMPGEDKFNYDKMRS